MKAVSGSYDNTCRIWDLATGQCLHVLRGHYHQVYAVGFDGDVVTTGSLDSTVRIWSAETGQCLRLLSGHTSLVGQLQLSTPHLLTGGSDGRVIHFLEQPQPFPLPPLYSRQHSLCAHDNSVTCLQFDDRFIISGGNDGHVKLWSLEDGSYIRDLIEPCDAVWRVGMKGDRLVVLCQRGGRTIMEVWSFRPEDVPVDGMEEVPLVEGALWDGDRIGEGEGGEETMGEDELVGLMGSAVLVGEM